MGKMLQFAKATVEKIFLGCPKCHRLDWSAVVIPKDAGLSVTELVCLNCETPIEIAQGEIAG